MTWSGLPGELVRAQFAAANDGTHLNTAAQGLFISSHLRAIVDYVL
jgi:hypothetical protein